jgi:DNA primase catalytic subunit
VVGGRYGKVKGFNFYVQKNERLKPFERRKLLSQSEILISNLIDEETKRKGCLENINKNITLLDSSYSDEELVETWNKIYDEYGIRFERFRTNWERDNIGKIKDFGDKKDESKSFNPLKINWILNRKSKINISDLG